MQFYKKYLKVLLICVLFSVLATTTYAKSYCFKNISTREGLSQNDINDLLQDKDGFIWIATHEGLNRYDGYNFKTYRMDPVNHTGLSTNLIQNIAEDENRNLWLTTAGGGICKLNLITDNIQVFKNTKNSPKLLTSNITSCVKVMSDGSIWVGSGKGINIVREENGKYAIEKIDGKIMPEISSFNIFDIEEDIYGRVWLGTEKGLFVIENVEENKVVHLVDPNAVYDICISEKDVFIAQPHEVVHYGLSIKDLSYLQKICVCKLISNEILIGDRGELLIATYNGLWRLQKETDTYKLPELVSEEWCNTSISIRISSMLKDASGSIWVGTMGGGVYKNNEGIKKFRHYKRTELEGSVSQNKIRSIYQDNEGNIWMGTEHGDVNFLSVKKKKNYETGFSYIKLEGNDPVNRANTFVDISQNNEQVVMVGATYPEFAQLIKVEGENTNVISNGILSQIKSKIFCFIKDRYGNVWIGTYGGDGLYKYINDEKGERLLYYKNTSEPGSISSNIVRSLLEDKAGNIWIGTDRGLNLLPADQQHLENPEFTVFKNDENNTSSISYDYILPICQTRDGTIYVGTMGGGLNMVINHACKDSIKFKKITMDNGLPNNVIKGILEDEYGFLWISSNKGLSRFDVTNDTFTNYDTNDGLQDLEFSEVACCKLEDGEMIFGGVNGFNAFYPKEIVMDKFRSKTVFTDFQVLNESITSGQKHKGRVLLENSINHTGNINLKYSENSFAIHFAALHYAAPKKNKYKYMLEGFDKEWIKTQSNDRIANYTNVPPGKYTFKVLTSNNDAVWGENPKTIHITVNYPWYNSKLARAIYLVCIIFLLWLYRKYSIKRVQKKNEMMMEHIKSEKANELTQMKFQFFTNVSHEFLTPLTLILSPLERLINGNALFSDTKVKESYKLMHRNASVLLNLISQLIDFSKFDDNKLKVEAARSNIVTFLEDIYTSFIDLAESKKMDYEFDFDAEEIFVWFDHDKMQKIMFNLISNAFKYTPDGGKIFIKVEEGDTGICIKVIDNGEGIPREIQSRVFEQFFQGPKMHNKKHGAGIGLALVKGLVEMHKGDISFESEKNVGTTFFVKFKKGNAHLKKSELIETRKTTTIPKAIITSEQTIENTKEEQTNINGNKPEILLVEDNPELQVYLKDCLSDNYKVHMAINGKIAIEKLSRLNPDIIISDVMMPEMDGFELCEAVKSNDETSHIPVMLLTAKSDPRSREKGYNTGADGYISKPFTLEVLNARIKNLMGSRESLKNKFRSSDSIQPPEVKCTSMDETFVNRVVKIVDENISASGFTVTELADKYGMSQIVFHKRMKSITGQNPKAFIRSLRMKRAAQLLRTGRYNVKDICFEVGFTDPKYFRDCFKAEFGITPSGYAKQNLELVNKDISMTQKHRDE